MTAARCRVVVLHTDQGMGTLIKIYNKAGKTEKLTSLALVDLGSETRTKRYAGDALDVIANALGEMTTPFFDFIVISHQDTDHWSLLPDLSKRLQKDYPKTGVGMIYRGGFRWKKRATSAVGDFANQWGADEEPWSTTLTDYSNPATGPTWFHHIDGVVFRVLMVNADSTRSVANGTSAVITVEFGGTTAILPGDATAQTLAAINATLWQWRNAGKANPVHPCLLLTAPHHGSLATISDNFTTKNPKLTIANAFANYVSARWLAASAGYESHFNHPSKVVMETLSPAVGKDAVTHNFIVFNNDTGRWESISNTNVNIFTTISTLTDPPVRTSWEFDMLPGGMVAFRSVLTPASRRLLQARARPG